MSNKTPKSKIKEISEKYKAGFRTEFSAIIDDKGVQTWKAHSILENYFGRKYQGIFISTTKKDAENSACEEILRKIDVTGEVMVALSASKSSGLSVPAPQSPINSQLLDGFRSINNNGSNVSTNSLLDSEDLLIEAKGSNSIGELKNVCDKKHWALPVYDSKQSGEGQDPVHKVTCSLLTFKTTGTSKQKQNSKHLAAYKMLKALNENGMIPNNSSLQIGIAEPQINFSGFKNLSLINSPSSSSARPNLAKPGSSGNSSNINNDHDAIKVQSKVYYYSKLELGPNVYQGYFERKEVKAAVKKIPNFSNITNQGEIREIKILQEIRHPNLVQYFAYENDNYSNYYIAMEFAELGTLKDYFDEVQPEFIIRKKLLKDSILGLEFLHLDATPRKQIIVHRDIKPQNILIFQNAGRPIPVAKIADFGISKPIASKTLGQETIVRCTLDWTSPESIQAFPGIQKVTTSTDIFSLGLVIYWLMSGGIHPFDKGKAYEIRSNIVQTPPNWELIGTVKESYTLKHLLEKMLDKEPNSRPLVTEVKKHPFFWDEQQNHAFIIAVGNDLKNHNGLIDSSFGSLYFLHFGNWVERLDDRVKYFLETKQHFKNYIPNSLSELIDFIRDEDQHYDELPLFPDLFGESCKVVATINLYV